MGGWELGSEGVVAWGAWMSVSLRIEEATQEKVDVHLAPCP